MWHQPDVTGLSNSCGLANLTTQVLLMMVFCAPADAVTVTKITKPIDAKCGESDAAALDCLAKLYSSNSRRKRDEPLVRRRRAALQCAATFN